MNKEKLIKTRQRVQQHGEVFTPVKIVKEMISMKGLSDKVKNIRATILEPAVGEGVFLVEILNIRLKKLLKECEILSEFENKALLALSTLYGIELLEDNAQKCVMSIYTKFIELYELAINKFKGKKRKNVMNSAKTIIAANIQQGNFLTRLNLRDKPIVFSEWREVKSRSKNTIKIVRTEHTLDSIYNQVRNEDGFIESNENRSELQLMLFEVEEVEEKNENLKDFRYIPCSIINVYKEEMEEYER